MKIQTKLARIKQQTISVGNGRGFVLLAESLGPIVITAAHCIGKPRPSATAESTERLYKAIFGPLDARERPIPGQLAFADPVADIAVLGRPDWASMPDETSAYECFTKATCPLRISAPPRPLDHQMLEISLETEGAVPSEKYSPVWVLSLKGEWTRCSARWSLSGHLWVKNERNVLSPGMSGSPIVDESGAIVGAVTVVKPSRALDDGRGYGPQPRLTEDLPRRLVKELRRR